MAHLNSVYYTRGKGKSLFFLHGLGASLHQTVSLLDGIKNTQLISLDFPGHGKSPYPIDGNEPSFDYYTEELTIDNKSANLSLSGTLTLPSNDGISNLSPQ